MKGWQREFHFAKFIPESVPHSIIHPGKYELKQSKQRNFRFDFANPSLALAVEIEGGIWTNGRHTRGQGFLNDCHKYNLAAAMGWQVFRFPTELVESGQAINFIVEYLRSFDQ